MILPLLILFIPRNTSPPYTPTPSLHDALPILAVPSLTYSYFSDIAQHFIDQAKQRGRTVVLHSTSAGREQEVEVLEGFKRSEEHTTELQSRGNLVCSLLLEKKNNKGDKTDGSI